MAKNNKFKYNKLDSIPVYFSLIFVFRIATGDLPKVDPQMKSLEHEGDVSGMRKASSETNLSIAWINEEKNNAYSAKRLFKAA